MVDDFFDYSADKNTKSFKFDNTTIIASDNANIVVDIGHDSLMEWSWKRALPDSWLLNTLSKQQQKSCYAAVCSCKSEQYFTLLLLRLGITPLILILHRMTPEAYSVHAMITCWLNCDSKTDI